jgi:hypothetical protein
LRGLKVQSSRSVQPQQELAREAVYSWAWSYDHISNKDSVSSTEDDEATTVLAPKVW